MTYIGATKTMSITYGTQSWTQDVSAFVGTNQAMSFSIAASTGANMNLQQLRNVEFTYTVAQGSVIANYVDDQGNTIAPSVTASGDITTAYTTEQKIFQDILINHQMEQHKQETIRLMIKL